MELFAKIVNAQKLLTISGKVTPFWILTESQMHVWVLPMFKILMNWSNLQKQPSRGILSKSFSENMQKFTGEHPYTHAKVQSNFIEIALLHGCSPVNLLHIFTTTFPKNTNGWLVLNPVFKTFCIIV